MLYIDACAWNPESRAAIDADTEKSLVDTAREGEGERNGERGMGMKAFPL